MIYPRPITSVHQIEVSSDCNLRCVYCPSRNLDKPLELPMAKGGGFGRAKEHMDLATYGAALRWASHFERQGTQGELALTGIGEALLHPHITDMLDVARQALPHNLITLSTNGLTLAKRDEAAEAQLDALERNNIRVYVSLHRPERAKLAIDVLAERGLLAATNQAFATEAFDWAGALDWSVSIPEGSVVCEYLRTGWCVVLADGRISACCLDAEGASAKQTGQTVWDDPATAVTAPWTGERSSCSACHMRIPGDEV